MLYSTSGSIFNSERQARQLGVAFSVNTSHQQSADPVGVERHTSRRSRASVAEISAINAIVAKQAGSFCLKLGMAGVTVDWPLVGKVVTIVGWVYGFSSTISPCHPNPAS